MSAKVLKRIFMSYELDSMMIDIWNNPFGNLGIKTISKSMKSLWSCVSLKIGNCDISDEGFINLFWELEENECVSHLSIQNSNSNFKNRLG